MNKLNYSTEIENNESAIEIIMFYINTMKSKEVLTNSLTLGQGAAKYLIGQTIRQLNISKEKYYLSEEASKKWNAITNDDISNYYYRKKVTKKKEEVVTVKIYKGAKKTPEGSRELQKGDKFLFREVFHDDHIVPVSVITKELLNLDVVSYKNVSDILNKLSICRMLKSEDRLISERFKRVSIESSVIKDLYHTKYGIKIKDYNY